MNENHTNILHVCAYFSCLRIERGQKGQLHNENERWSDSAKSIMNFTYVYDEMIGIFAVILQKRPLDDVKR